MSIRANQNRKDRNRKLPVVLTLVESPAPMVDGDELLFWTVYPPKKTLVDLRVLRDGQQSSRGNGKWTGPFKGRPALILEMLPVLKEHLLPMAPKSVSQIIVALKNWWRAFDSLEVFPANSTVLTSTVQLIELHRQRALERNLDRAHFNIFILLASRTRVSLGHKPLFWPRLESSENSRKLPPSWQTDIIRRELKHRWFSVLDRWDLAEALQIAGAPLVSLHEDAAAFENQERILKNYRYLEDAIREIGHPRPAHLVLREETLTYRQYYAQGYKTFDMLKSRYPDGDDIRTAFLLCLATTGWNAAVLMDIDVSTEFIQTHPKDPKRYILRGFKARTGTWQSSEGLYKSQASAAAVIQALIKRTEPLRMQLRKELREVELLIKSSTSAQENTLRQKIEYLSEGIRSPWLYVNISSAGIHWLGKSGDGANEFLQQFIEQLNTKQKDDKKINFIKASDFRDAHAANSYHANGGSIIAVMKALNHRSLSSTKNYLDNTLLNEEHRALYETFSAGLWHEIKVHRRVDPTVIAKWSRDGFVSDEERERLAGYRKLMRSRIGVGCKDPTNPPSRVAPGFVADGQKLCHVQRCLLCIEHAVIFTESLPGICKRSAELQHIRQRMGVTAFLQSSFREELTNTEVALLGFDRNVVAAHIADWSARISGGTHRVPEFDGQNT